MRIIESSATPLPVLPRSPRMDPARLRAIRAHAALVVMDRHEAGLSADGRVLDFVKYAEHLRAGRP